MSLFNIDEYMTAGIEKIVKNAVKATFSNPAESLFIASFAKSAKVAANKRHSSEVLGKHIPPFLIASITSACNLHCAGCYSRANHACSDEAPSAQLTSDEWLSIFHEADELGISFILLAGGEPLLRKDVLDAAASVKGIAFPVFTNGTMIGKDYLNLFSKNRNLIPVLSIEGEKNNTDTRRGEGVYDRAAKSMKLLKEQKLLFGNSVTVTTENLKEVTSDSFINSISEYGSKLIIYVEYVPVNESGKELAPGDAERSYMTTRLEILRQKYPEMIFISFPGDEKSSGGCLAAGRGFFHINSHGGAEPCPFSPYSDINVKDTSLSKAINSKLFKTINDGSLLTDEHAGGCVLYERRAQVEAIVCTNSSSSSC